MKKIYKYSFAIITALFSACTEEHHYVPVSEFQLQSFAERSEIYAAAMSAAEDAGYTLYAEDGILPSEAQNSERGILFFKNERDYILQFGPTFGTSCYSLSVSAYSEALAEQEKMMADLLRDRLVSALGSELRYIGSGECPDMAHNNAPRPTQ